MIKVGCCISSTRLLSLSQKRWRFPSASTGSRFRKQLMLGRDHSLLVQIDQSIRGNSLLFTSGRDTVCTDDDNSKVTEDSSNARRVIYGRGIDGQESCLCRCTMKVEWSRSLQLEVTECLAPSLSPLSGQHIQLAGPTFTTAAPHWCMSVPLDGPSRP